MVKTTKTPDEWRAILNKESFYVTRESGTERPFNNAYWDNHDSGIYHCICCDTPLFDAAHKYDSGTGWPSFYAPIAKENISEKLDKKLFRTRTEILCSNCDAHLGHVFNDGPEPTKLRYCMNSAALNFKTLS